MIAVEVPRHPTHRWGYDLLPFSYLSGRKWGVYSDEKVMLSNRLAYWIYTHNIEYNLQQKSDDKCYILFKKESDAILFKLTWC